MRSSRSKTRLLSLCLLLLEFVSALSIKLPARALTYNALGCYTDNTNGKRALSGKSFAADDMSVAMCATFCTQFDLFGVEYGRECYCGNTRDTGSTLAASSDCSFPCAANPNSDERCGAGDRLNLYSNLSPVSQQPATLNGFKSLGCFVDNGERVLPNGYIGASDMTAAKCAQNCAGYKYFGTEWSSECFCGNTVPTVTASASECNMVCSGNDQELCGGSLRLNVYQVDATSPTVSVSTTAPSTGPTASVATISGYEYQGCYTDNVPERVLAGKVSTDPTMTLEMCATFCKIGGYSWFGVEYNFECYCGTKLDPLSTKAPERECAATCNGNTSQMCGGANRLNVYKSPELAAPTQNGQNALKGFQYRACWTDKVDDRSLKEVDYRTDDMTVEKCADRCQGYAYFGLEYSRECFCGNTLLGTAAPEAECGMLCMGANNEWCGGPDRLNLYAQATASSPVSSLASSTIASTTSDLASSTAVSSAVSLLSTSLPVESVTPAAGSVSSTQPSSSISSSTLELSTSSSSASSVVFGSTSSSSSEQASSSSSTPSALSVSETVILSSVAVSSQASTVISSTAEVIVSSSVATSSQASSITSSTVDIITSSSSLFSPQSSSTLPPSTSMTPTPTTSSGPALTTITSCPASPTYAGTPENCYAPGYLPQICRQLTSNFFWASVSSVLAPCPNALSVFGSSGRLPAATCFPSLTPYYRPANAAAATSMVSSVLQCLSASSASLYCQYDSTCATSTYTVGQVPSPTPSTSVDLFQDGGFESGTLGNWVQSAVLSGRPLRPVINGARPRSGNYGISMPFDNSNGDSYLWYHMTKLVPGKKYQFQAYVYQTNANNGCGLVLTSEQASLSMSMRGAATYQWLASTLTFTATRSWDKLNVQFYCNVNGGVNSAAGMNDIWLDDWTLKQID